MASPTAQLTLNTLAACAHVLAVLGQRERAVRALGANWAQGIRMGIPIEPEGEEIWLRQTGLAEIRDSMPTTQWDALIQAGNRASVEDAFADAFAPVSQTDGDGSPFTT